mgnify:CR=1 FL=1
MLLAVTQNDPEKELEYLDAFSEKQVDDFLPFQTSGYAQNGSIPCINSPCIRIGYEYFFFFKGTGIPGCFQRKTGGWGHSGGYGVFGEA